MSQLSDNATIIRHEQHRLIAFGMVLAFFVVAAFGTCVATGVRHERAFEDACMQVGGRVIKGDGHQPPGAGGTLSCVKQP